MDDILNFLCKESPDYVGPTAGYESVPRLPEVTPFRARILDELQRFGGVFRCRYDELGQWNVEPGRYHHLEGANGPQRPGVGCILETLEQEGWIIRGSYWGPKSLEHFAGPTLYGWTAGTKLRSTRISRFIARVQETYPRIRRCNERKFDATMRKRFLKMHTRFRLGLKKRSIGAKSRS